MTEWPESRQLASQYHSPSPTGIGFAQYASTGTVTPELWENIKHIEGEAERRPGDPAVERWAEDMVALREALEAEGVTEERKVIYWAPAGKAPAKLVAGVNWWLNSAPDHSEDVVALTKHRQDALILCGLSDVTGVVWVDPEGTVRELRGTFRLVHMEDDEEEA